MKTYLLPILCAIFMSLPVYGQQLQETHDHSKCGHAITMYRLMQENPETFATIQKEMKEARRFAGKKSGAATVYTFPVVFHLVHENGLENITDDQCIEQVKQLNEDFNADHPEIDQIITEFEDIIGTADFNFVLARKDPEGNSTSGIVRHFEPGGSTQYNGSEYPMKTKLGWPTDKYLNIYVVRQADYGSAGSPTNNGSGWASPRTGTVCSYWAIGRTRVAADSHYGLVTHELGHYYSLAHTFSDGIGDTPRTNGAHNSKNGSCDLAYAPYGSVTNVQNFMDYSHCQIMFTEEQASVMRSYTTRNYGNLTSEANLIATGIMGEPISALFWGDYNSIPPGNPVKFTDFSETQTGTIDTYEWEFVGGTPASYTGQTPPQVVYPNLGTYDVKLTITNSEGESDVEFKEGYVVVHDDIVIRDGDFVVNEGKFWDPGFDGIYSVRTHQTLTMRPSIVGGAMKVTFSSFEMENVCEKDGLTIYNGPDVNSPLIGVFCGTNSPGVVESTHPSGALTFKFDTDVTGRRDGWEARYEAISVIPEIPVASFTNSETTLCLGDSISFRDRSTGIPETRTWMFEGGTPATSTDEDPVVVYNTPGIYKVSLTVTNSLGTDTKLEMEYVVAGVGSVVTLMEGFEGDAFAPENWTLNNPDDRTTWARNTETGNGSDACMVIDNYDYAYKGELDELTSTGLDLRSYGSFLLSFDVAYAIYSASNPDELRVFVSIDCAESWEEVFMKGPEELSTISGVTDQANWKPSEEAHWRKEMVDLTDYVGNANVQVKFQNKAGYGANIWIDNINLQGSVGVNDVKPLEVSVFPNPSTGIFTIKVPESKKITYQVFTLEGRKITAGQMNASSNQLNLSAHAKGVYFLQLNSEDRVAMKQLIVK